jgi:hypothetical protein
MKTTVELPDDLARRAKIEAATRGVTLKQILIEALEERLRRGNAEPAWRAHAGALRDLQRETRRIQARIDEEFERIDDEEK